MAKEMKSPKKPVPSADRDELAQVIADSLNKLYKDGQVAYFLDGQEETPTDLTDFISTGNTMLDIAISNRPNGGIAAGRRQRLATLQAQLAALPAEQADATEDATLARWFEGQCKAERAQRAMERRGY